VVRQRRVFNTIRVNRLPKISRIVLGVISVFLVVCCCFIYSAFRDTPKEPFIGVAVLGNPVTIVYIDRTTKHTSLISLPSSTFIDASSSYGTFPVSSLWRFGEIEKKGGQIFASSLGTTLGIPIKYYLGLRNFTDTPTSAQDNLSNIFNVLNIPKIMTRNLETNMPLATYVEVTGAVRDSLVTSTILDLSKTFALSETELSDGTKASKVNAEGADLVFRQTHELNVLRQENIRVSVVNTTGVSGLGQKVARVLSHAGITVVDTGSEEKQFETCEVTAGKDVLTSLTVKSIVSFLSCSVRTSDDTGKVEVVLRLGKKEIQKF
jgi:hypothetical protein